MAKPHGKIQGYNYFYAPNHPLANAAGIVYEHRIIASEMLGRLIERYEIVHHIDGVRDNNVPSNLMIMTPAGHSDLHATERAKSKDILAVITCRICGKRFETRRSRRPKYCSVHCSRLGSRKVKRPSKDKLAEDINSMSWVDVGKKYNVSDSAVRKWARKYDLIK